MTENSRPNLPPPRGKFARQPERISTILGRVLAKLFRPATPPSVSDADEAKRRRILARATRRRTDG